MLHGLRERFAQCCTMDDQPMLRIILFRSQGSPYCRPQPIAYGHPHQGLHISIPNTGNGLSFTTFVNTVPINEGRSINRFALIRNLEAPIVPGVTGKIFNMGAWDKLAHDAMIKCAHFETS